MPFHFHEKKVCFLRIRRREDCLKYNEKNIKIEWSSVNLSIAITGKKDFEDASVSIVFSVFSSKHDASFSAWCKFIYLFHGF